MSKYKFQTSPKVEQYCDSIVHEMMIHFAIPHTEAVGRVNRMWSHLSSIVEDDDMIFHLVPEEWAYDIYYGKNSSWWKKNKSELTPLPFDEDIE